MKQTLENQHKLIKTIKNIKKNNRISHAYLLIGDDNLDFEEISKFMVKSFICSNNSEIAVCDNCSICNRIDNNNYADFIYLNAKKEKIGKQEILDIKDQFSKTSQEDNKKIYVIENVEEVTINALNSLLLFLENPVEDVIAIFTTSKLNKVLNTIKSRCQLIHLEKINRLDKCQKLLVEYDDLTANYLSYFENKEYELINELLPSFIEFLNLYNTNNLKYITFLINNIFKEKDRQIIQAFSKMLKIFTNDYYQNKKYSNEKYNLLIDSINEKEILKFLIISNEIEDNNFKGSNMNLLVDKLIYLLEEKNE